MDAREVSWVRMPTPTSVGLGFFRCRRPSKSLPFPALAGSSLVSRKLGKQ